MNHTVHNNIVTFIWGIADDVLRDVYVRGKYRDVILPMDEKVTRDIFEDLAEEVASSEEYQQAKAHSDRQNARIAFEKMLVTAVQKYIFTRTDFYRDFTNQPEVKSFLVNELFRYDYDG